MDNILIDTCFWYALYDRRDSNYIKANKLIEYLQLGRLILPFPTLYETINTRFARNKYWVVEFNKIINDTNTILLHDDSYKAEALNLS